MPKVLVIDNYDSFTFNLVHLIGPLCDAIEVARNDALSVADIRERAPDAVVLSPGPCSPNEAGICLDVVRELSGDIPLFGVCLGLQAIGQAFGGEVVRAPVPLHGKVSTIRHKASGLFRGLNDSFEATRYHSLVVDRASCPGTLAVTAETDGLIMGLQHTSLPVHGVQFHPESIRSQHGQEIVKNFLDLAREWNATRDTRASGVH
ncbi:anthranilate synthase component II [Methylobacterium aerolatum]|uniref:Anthranilate synthase component 2 n=1 Tax=Methylobacterium aerolatum TaxID=418708 RepID=A0ABU0HZ61_9HYPH|nr:aminodeoxychorismate/anthranilate synthase component II [Methylobacterium aerolatum]MDQ0447633.1 anthranilate synthase component 2 [Methylobacterium aerolatum]GJD34733.1 Anthranilate synthase component 2 [Methylobacterium aerolatum]